MKVTYRSPSGHSSIPHPDGVDALEKTVNAAAALMQLGRRVSHFDEELGAWSKLSVTMIESGNTVNMYPSEGHLVIDRRLVPGETLEECHSQIRQVLDKLRDARAGLASGGLIDLAAVDLHEALYLLGRITGDSVDEKLLDDIFSRFCVGK